MMPGLPTAEKTLYIIHLFTRQCSLERRPVTTAKQPSSLPLVLLSFCGFVLIGASAGAWGVLVPSQMAYYHVDKTIIGIFPVFLSIGYFLSAASAGLFTQKLGQRRYLIAGIAIFGLSMLAYSLRPPSIVLVLAVNLLVGVGSAVLDAGFNAAITALPSSTKLLNYLHAFYGAGALIGPLVASAFLVAGLAWNVVYLVWCVMALLLLGGVLFLRIPASESAPEHADQHSDGNVLRAALTFGVVWLGALFLFLYVGVEVSIGNWNYSFSLDQRMLGTLVAGWIASGYWLGLMLGRFFIGTLAEWLHLSATRMIYLCLIGLAVSVALVWGFSSALTTALGFCLIGFFLGPLFPTTIAVIPRLVPERIVPSAVGFLVGSSVVGGAIFPWLAGALAQSAGLWTLLPYTLALTVLMCVNWWIIARRPS
jgi:fucose permease